MSTRFYCNKCDYLGVQQSGHQKPNALAGTVCWYDAVPLPLDTTQQPSALEIVARQHAARGAIRWMFLRNLAFRGSLEAFVAIHQLDWMGSFEKIEQAIDKAIEEGWK